jgi:alkylhydroperoxidase family enzyme
MATHTRVTPAEITGLYGIVAKRLSKKMLGEVPAPLGVYWHNQAVLKTMFGFSGKAQKWDECEDSLKSLAHMAAVSMVGCGFCLDLAYFQAHHEDLEVNKAREVPRWRESDQFTPLEREVMEYAEAMTQTPPTVSDDLSSRLLATLGAPALVELTAFIAAANLVSRANTALGIEAQGFSEACGLEPLAEPARPVASA